MTSTDGTQELGQRIEHVIREHVAASLVVAHEAVARGFATASRSSRPPSGPTQRARRNPGKKRPSEDIAALGERFYKAACAGPARR